MQSRRVKISVSLPRDLVARMDRTARVEARSRSRVLEGWLRATARESAARELEAATVEYYESLTAADRREDDAMAAASSAAKTQAAVSVVDLDEVWKAVSVDVPKLLQTLAPLAPKPRE